jgi:hypothetical protein
MSKAPPATARSRAKAGFGIRSEAPDLANPTNLAPSRSGDTRCRINGSGHSLNHPGSDTFQLKVSTANGTTWESVKAYVHNSKMEVICVQEHKITTQQGLDAASDWCRRNGWKSRWSMANPSDCGGSGSGGTAVLVRDHLGLACANNLLSPSSRRCAGKVELPGGRRILVMS